MEIPTNHLPYQDTEMGSPNEAPSLVCIAEVVGTGQKLNPKVEDKIYTHEHYFRDSKLLGSLTKMTSHVFQVIGTVSSGTSLGS
jgi:hypothetical protein